MEKCKTTCTNSVLKEVIKNEKKFFGGKNCQTRFVFRKEKSAFSCTPSVLPKAGNTIKIVVSVEMA